MLALAFAQTAQMTPAQGQPDLISRLLPFAIIFIIFYFVLIRPQKKTQNEHVKMLESLKKNDEVITNGGIYGTIVNMQEGVLTLRVDDNTRLKVQRSAVSKLVKSRD